MKVRVRVRVAKFEVEVQSAKVYGLVPRKQLSLCSQTENDSSRPQNGSPRDPRAPLSHFPRPDLIWATMDQLDDPTFAAMRYVFEASGELWCQCCTLLHELLPHTP